MAAIIIGATAVRTIRVPDGTLLYVDRAERPFSDLNRQASDIAVKAGVAMVFGDAVFVQNSPTPHQETRVTLLPED